MAHEPPILGLILAGGQAERFGGGPKGLALLNGAPLIGYVAESLKHHAGRVAISVSAQNAGDYAALDLPLVLDHPDAAARGPLSGLLAGLDWAVGHKAKALLVAPCDAPFLTPEVWRALLLRLEETGAEAVFAATPAETHPLCAALRPALADGLRAYLADPNAKLAVRAFLDGVPVEIVRFADEPQFLNVNSKEELMQAEAVFASRESRS